MELSEYKTPSPEAFRGLIEGVENLHDYLRTNEGQKLYEAERQLSESLAFDPNFAPAQYYKAIVLTHARKADDAIKLLETLHEEDAPFKVEVLYNLAFAYAKKYRYDFFWKALGLLEEAYKLSHRQLLNVPVIAKWPDLVLLIQTMRAWAMAAFAGRTYDHPEDLKERRLKFLPRAVWLTKSVLGDPCLNSLSTESRSAVELEAHNAAGIAYMRMGQYASLFIVESMKSKFVRSAVCADRAYRILHSVTWLTRSDKKSLFGQTNDAYWNRAAQSYDKALRIHHRDVRVLDNVSTLNLIQACHALRKEDNQEAQLFSEKATEVAQTAISYNRLDRFRHYNLAKSLALSGEWRAAMRAADQILEQPGEVTDVQVTELKDAIAKKEVNLILKHYPTD